MNKLLILLFASMLAPLTAQAQQPGGMSQEQMQRMMQMQTCFAKVDQQALMALGQKAQAMETEVKKLCKAGKRGEAQSTAIKFGLAMSKDKNVQAARECGEMARGMMPQMDYPTSEKDFEGGHICDGY